MLLYEDIKERIPVKLFTDSEPTLESIASSRQVERKSLRMIVKELKEKLFRRRGFNLCLIADKEDDGRLSNKGDEDAEFYGGGYRR